MLWAHQVGRSGLADHTSSAIWTSLLVTVLFEPLDEAAIAECVTTFDGIRLE